MKLTPQRANFLFVLLVSLAMTAVMSFGILLLRMGWQPNFIQLWLGDFLVGSCLSVPTGFTVVPLIRRWIDGLTLPATGADAHPTSTPAELDPAVNGLVRQYADALNRRDASRFAQIFHPDAQYINVVGADIRGRQALAEWHHSLFDGSGTGRGLPDFSKASIEVTRHETLAIGGIAAVVNVYWTQRGAVDPHGKAMDSRNGLSAWVVTLEQGHWLIKAMNNKDLPDKPLTTKR